MATTLKASIRVLASTDTTKSGRKGGGSIDRTLTLTNGTGPNQSDKGYYDDLTITAAGAPLALDFNAGGLIDLNGDVVTWVEMTSLIIWNKDAAQPIVVGGHANPLDFGCGANTITIKPGEAKVLINCGSDPAYPIGAGASDTLKLAIAAGANVELEIIATGRTA